MKTQLAADAALAAIFALGSLLAPATAIAARQAVCEHPEGSHCTAKKDTGRIVCQCLDGEHELTDPEITDDDDAELMAACWDAWSATCAPWDEVSADCEQPQLGSCEVSGRDGGFAQCDCEVDGFVEREGLGALEGLDDEAMVDACHEQLMALCSEPEPEPTMAPVVETPEPEVASCAVDPHARTPWLLAVVLGGAALRRRRRR